MYCSLPVFCCCCCCCCSFFTIQCNWWITWAIAIAWRETYFYDIDCFLQIMHLSMSCQRGRGRQGMGWGDLIVFVSPGVGHLTYLVLPWEGIFESFFARRGYIWLPTRTKKTETEHVSPLPRFTHAPYGLGNSENHEGQREQAKAEWISLFCLQISFVLACFWSIEPLKILWYQSRFLQVQLISVWLIRYNHCTKLVKLTFFLPFTKNGIFKLTKMWTFSWRVSVFYAV